MISFPDMIYGRKKEQIQTKRRSIMQDLTFGEQVKIILIRKGMTIKELAEMIEEQTGKKMSRQNLTQRLGRDNFQEQDMRMIAAILECPFSLSILGGEEDNRQSTEHYEADLSGIVHPVIETEEKAEAEPDPIEDIQIALPLEELGEEPAKKERSRTGGLFKRIGRQKEQQEQKGQREQKEQQEQIVQPERTEQEEHREYRGHREHKITSDELLQEESVQQTMFLDMPEETGASDSVGEEASVRRKVPVRTAAASDRKTSPAGKKAVSAGGAASGRSAASKTASQAAEAVDKDAETRSVLSAEKEEQIWQGHRHIKRSEEEEDLSIGELNPYTGHEYESNSVKMHPKRIGYVQVYDRKIHRWEDMTEWAFLGMQERQKILLGRDYEPPIYLD